MSYLRQILSTSCVLLCTIVSATAQQHLSDSLQRVLARTVDPAERVQLLLNLKDLNEDSGLNLPYSIQLFREAAAIGDVYAMSTAIVPIISRFAPYAEMQDSLRHYVRTLRALTPGTSGEGMDRYAEMAIGFYRLRSLNTRENCIRYSREAIAWSDSLARHPETVYERARRLTIHGYAAAQQSYYVRHQSAPMALQAGIWKEAYELLHDMPEPSTMRHFSSIIYYSLSGAYNQGSNYEEQVKLTADFVALLDEYYRADRLIGRRPYLYADNSYVTPYQQLIRGALNIGRKDLAQQHFQDFRDRMLRGRGEDLIRNKTYLYELGYLLNGITGDYEQCLLYSDSLVNLIERGLGYFRMKPAKIYQAYRDRGLLLARAGRYGESFDTYARTVRIQDSIFRAERRERSETLRLRQEMDRLKLNETRSVIRNRTAVIFSFTALGLLLLGTGIHFLRAWRRNHRLQQDILRLSRKGQESEHMKSVFINTICRGIGPSLDDIDGAAHALMVARIGSPECPRLLETIRESTEMLLSTLDNMLEAANLDSLTGRLQLEPADVDEICRAELLSASRLRHNDQVAFRIETPGTPCTVRTHPKYFTFVIRALLDNAGKYTRTGSVTLRYETDAARNELRVAVTDTGCGVPPERRDEIFRPICDSVSASRGMSLPLCRMIVARLSGSIRLDETYGPGARFIFTIPLMP